MTLEENKVTDQTNTTTEENTSTDAQTSETTSTDSEVSVESKEKVEEKTENSTEKVEETEENKTEVASNKEDDLLESKIEELSDSDKEALIAEIREAFASNNPIEVEVLSKAIGGLRVTYKNMPMFLPTSHFSMKRSASDEEINEVVGQTLKVNIHEIKEENDQFTVIVTRKKLIEDEFWGSINVGDKVEGTVTSTPSFGVFLDIGGVEGLCHVSKLAHHRISNPATFCKPGDKMEVIITEIDKENQKISLSRQELEPSPWDNIEEEIKPETTVKGIVRRITDFGVYVELKPGVDGLLRNNELSWTKRILDPKEILTINQQIDVYVVNINPEKQTATLSLRRTKENPWDTLAERFPLESVYHAEVLQVNPKGAIFALNDEVDGFMPKSKMRGIAKGNKVPFEVGEKAEVKVTEINPETESLILAPQGYEESQQPRMSKGSKDKFKGNKGNSSFTLGDLLADKMKDSLKKIGN